MKALMVGFERNEEKLLTEVLPILAAYPLTFTKSLPSVLHSEIALAVFSWDTPCFNLLGELDSRAKPLVLYQQVDGHLYQFVRITPLNNRTEEALEKAISKLMEVKKLSSAVRHDVRSPVQSIYTSTEKFVEFLALNDRKKMLSELDAIQYNTSRIYKSITRFQDFHSELEKLHDILTGKHEDKI